MSVETITKFFQQEGQDPTVQQQLQSASDRDSLVNLMVDIGEQKGYSFTSTEAQEWLNSAAIQMQNQLDGNNELSEDELEAVAGGATPTVLATGFLSGVTSWFGNKVMKKIFG